MLGGGSFVASFVVAGESGEEFLNIASCVDFIEELLGSPSAKGRSDDAVMGHDDLTRCLYFVRKAGRPSHGSTRWLPGGGWRDGRGQGRLARR